MRYVYVRVFVCSFVFELHTWKTNVTFSRNLLKVGYACFVSVHACACVSVFVCVLPSFTLPSGYFHIISF